MGNPIPYEALTGTIDGVNRVFFFSVPYTPGTAAIFLNGQLLTHPSGNPWTETDPSTGEVTLDVGCEPLAGDVVAGVAIDTAEPNEVEITEITGSIDALGNVGGVLDVQDDAVGDIDAVACIGGLVSSETELTGSLEPTACIGGILEEC